MSNKKKTPTDLTDLRSHIDNIDRQMLELLNRRAEISISVGKTKADNNEELIFKPFREKELLEKLANLNIGPLPESHLRAIYTEILSSSRRLQRPERVVYLGPEGTFSYFAALENLGHSAELMPKNNFEEIFRAVHEGEAELGLIPLENSLQGTVGQNLDMFRHYPVYIQAEVYYRISHGLLSKEKTIGAIKRVYSHSKAIDQCGNWLRTNLPYCERIPAASTASAVRRVSEKPEGAAAIGNTKLADMYDMNILADRLEDAPDNWTRFLVIGRSPAKEGISDKTSLLFTTPDKPGALADVLNTLAVNGINMTKLESRPAVGEKWKYVFFADLECNLAGEGHEEVITQLAKICNTFRILGSYPAGKMRIK
ncbi:MAG: prephenate dehydratase [Desulfovibrio sp.]